MCIRGTYGVTCKGQQQGDNKGPFSKTNVFRNNEKTLSSLYLKRDDRKIKNNDPDRSTPGHTSS